MRAHGIANGRDKAFYDALGFTCELDGGPVAYTRSGTMFVRNDGNTPVSYTMNISAGSPSRCDGGASIDFKFDVISVSTATPPVAGDERAHFVRQAQIDFRDFEKFESPETLELATKVFHRYEEIMINHYRTEVREVAGAADTRAW